MYDHLQVEEGQGVGQYVVWGWVAAGMPSLAGCKCLQRTRFFLALGAIKQGWAGRYK